jgi:hypothetical protein
MSKIALNSNASGTGVFTIASPNSDTDRTLTLPDESGTVVSENASGDVAVTGDITSNGNAVITTQSPQLGRRNLIINGAMQVAQRGISTTGITSTNGYYTVDRFRALVGAGTFTMTQESHANGPDGNQYSAKLAVTSTAATGSTSSVRLDYFTEAQNCTFLNYGASDAKAVTLSFWVKGSTTGTYAVSMYANDAARVIGSTYTINATDTWEYKTITFAGDTAGSFTSDNGKGLEVSWFLSAGSGLTSTDNTSWAAYATTNYAYDHTVDLANTSSGYLQITGVQLEVGDVATPFEHRSYGEELALCQRYYWKLISSAARMAGRPGFSQTNTSNRMGIEFPFEMRSAPTFSQSGILVWDGVTTYSLSSPTSTRADKFGFDADYLVTGITTLRPTWYYLNNSTDYLQFDAEL